METGKPKERKDPGVALYIFILCASHGDLRMASLRSSSLGKEILLSTANFNAPYHSSVAFKTSHDVGPFLLYSESTTSRSLTIAVDLYEACPCAWLCRTRFLDVPSFNPYNDPQVARRIMILVYRLENGGMVRLSDMPKVT